jgi:hypothetical protein
VPSTNARFSAWRMCVNGDRPSGFTPNSGLNRFDPYCGLIRFCIFE